MATVTVDMDVIDLRNARNVLVTGPNVDNLQGLLKGTRNPAWDPGPIDGLGGPGTRGAVLTFQAGNSLDADAIVGPLTWGELIAFPRLPAVALPPDDRPRTRPVDATDEFAALGAKPSFDALVTEVVAEVERRHPGEENAESPVHTDVASASSATHGVILLRRGNFADDSVAGYEYTVVAELAADGWVVLSAPRSTICWRGVSGDLCS